MEQIGLDPSLNPFSPGSGIRPPALTGRTGELNAFDLTLARTGNGAPARSMMLSGLRGVGKTVLLNEMRSYAVKHGWYTISFEASSSPSQREAVKKMLARQISALGRQLAARLDGLAGQASMSVLSAIRSIKSFSVKLGVPFANLNFEIQPTHRASSGDIQIDFSELIEDLVPALVALRAPLAIFIDELQDLENELLTAILMTQHQAAQERWPFLVHGAGLPTLPAHLSEQVSYAERMFDYRSIGQLEISEAQLALSQPIETRGGEFEDGALELLTDATGRYPYFIQEYGQQVWANASGKFITIADVKIACDAAQGSLDSGFFPARWGRATPLERALMEAMAHGPADGVKLSEIVESLGRKRSSEISVPRSGLIEKGLIYAPEHGKVAFTVPGMADFIGRVGSLV